MTLTLDSTGAIRIASGIISATTILADTSYLVSNWTRTGDMSGTPLYWKAISSDINNGVLATAIDGSGGLHGYASGSITFAMLTTQMVFYIWSDILGNKYVNDVTISVYNPLFGQVEYNCKLQIPTQLGSVSEQQNASIYTNVKLNWYRGTLLGASFDDSFDDSWG